MTNDLLYQLALTDIPHIGAVQSKILVEHFGNAHDIFKARIHELEKIEGIGTLRAQSIKHFNDFKPAEEELAKIEKYKIQPLFITDAGYPRRLHHCYDAPVLLFYKGTADLNNTKIVNIIGTRSHTDYGRHLTEQVIEELHPLQVLIVSGLAYGIDSIAHKTAVTLQSPTVGVLAHGMDSIYPVQHTTLARQMVQNGGLLSEFRISTPPDKHNFPRRNRIVAGMCDATIVIETATKGGSMITAELANSYNRDVFAFPGKTTDNKSSGCNYLIRNNKAILLENTGQLIESMGWADKKNKKKPQKELFISFTKEEQILVDILKEKDCVHIDEVYAKSGLTSSHVAAAMLSLEFQNVVGSLPGKMYKLL